MTRQVNAAAPLSDLTIACDTYEAALMANDLDTLDALFWDTPQVLRYSPSITTG